MFSSRLRVIFRLGEPKGSPGEGVVGQELHVRITNYNGISESICIF